MNRKRHFWTLSALALLVLGALGFDAQPSPAPGLPLAAKHNRSEALAPPKQQLVAAYGKLPLTFEANQGQTDPQVKFLSRGPGYTLFLTPTEAVLVLRNSKNRNSKLANNASGHGFSRAGSDGNKAAALAAEEESGLATVLRMKLLGANAHPKISALDPLPGQSNYFLGNDPKNWRTNIPTYTKVRYEDLYPGIDLVYYGRSPDAVGTQIPIHRDADLASPVSSLRADLEYDFIVHPGSDPAAIQLAFEGPDQLELDAQGNLILRFPKHDARSTEREVRLRKPRIYQEVDGVRQEISGGYVLLAENQIAFELAAYDRSKALVIDPTLVYSTYLGGSGADHPGRPAVGPDGSAYVVGSLDSSNFPLAAPLQGSLAGGVDGFVTKLSPDGSSLIYSTYVGGTNLDEARAVAVDLEGNAYVTGDTESPNFPTTAGAFDQTFNGTPPVRDAFVLKLGVSGSDLLYSTFLGGSGTSFGQFDATNDIAVDNTGNAYVTGCTGAPDFPTTEGAFDRTYNGPSFPINCVGDAFVTKLNASGTGLVYSTYLGGSGAEAATDISVDDSGNAYVVVATGSADFPTTEGAFSSSFKGGTTPTSAGLADAAVVKLNPAGSALIYSTYLGGSGFDLPSGIAIDSVGSAYITGPTLSTDFPTANALQPAYGGGAFDAFVTKLNPTGSALVYSTYLGGSGTEWGSDIGVDAGGNAYLTGFTDSTNFPTANALQPALAGSFDAYVAKLDAAGTALAYSTYLGGSGLDAARFIAVPSAGNAYVIGDTGSTNFPTTPAAFQTANAGGGDLFILKIRDNQPPVANAGADQTVECTNHTGTPVTLNGSASSDPDGDSLSFEWRDASGNVAGTTAVLQLTLPLGTHTFTLRVNDGMGGTANDSVIVTVRDTTPPSLTLSPTSITVVVPTATATGATVDLSGIASASDACDPSVTITHNAPAEFPIGLTTITFTATDDSGNFSQAQLTVHVVYNFIGYLAPIRSDGSSIFKSGRTIPIKFQLTAADGSFVTNATATLQVFKVTDAILGTVEEVTPEASGTSNTDNLFRFSDGNYIYNLNSTGYTTGTYLLRARVNDQTTHDVQVSIR